MKKRVSAKKHAKKIRVLAFGTFDWLHTGHLHYLQHARKLGDELIVIVARDVNVHASKGKSPIMNEHSRVTMVNALKPVDRAVLGNKGNIFTKVKELRPDVIALGYDQKPSNEIIRKKLHEHGLHPTIVRIRAFKPQEQKSSILKARARRNGN